MFPQNETEDEQLLFQHSVRCRQNRTSREQSKYSRRAGRGPDVHKDMTVKGDGGGGVLNSKFGMNFGF